MERLGWSALLEQELTDPRDRTRITHPFIELLRTTVLLQAQGWSDQVDVGCLRDRPK